MKPDPVLRSFRAMDASFGSVRSTWWGAVVTDARFPAISDVNYARVEVDTDEVRADDIDRALVPALRDAGVERIHHVVSFHPEQTRALLAELSGRGHRLTWDLVMRHEASGSTDPPPTAGTTGRGPSVVELADDDDLWSGVRASMAWFGIEPGDALEQLCEIERTVLFPAGKRWFGVRDASGRPASVGSVTVLDGVAYVDNVATAPSARRRGFGSAVMRHLIAAAYEDGVDDLVLLADPEAEGIVAMYEGLGFRPAGYLAATRGPVPTVEAGTERR